MITRTNIPLKFAHHILFTMMILIISACGVRDSTPPPIPTEVGMETLATAIVLTREAPPTGFDSVAFPRVDDNLRAVSGWRYQALVEFNGVFARTTRPASARTYFEVSFNQIGSARRVVAEIENNIQEQSEPLNYDAVRLGEDTFLVRDGVCLANAGDDADIAADLSAGAFIGGVNTAETAIQRAVINSQDVWRYTVNLPAVGLENSQILAFDGELWVAPEHNAVVRYYLTIEVENATLFGGALPVTGTLLVRYDLFDVGVIPNISVPFGC